MYIHKTTLLVVSSAVWKASCTCSRWLVIMQKTKECCKRTLLDANDNIACSNGSLLSTNFTTQWMISARYCRGRAGSRFVVVYMEYTTRTTSSEILYIASFTMFFVFSYAHHARSVSNSMACFLKDQIR